MSDASGNRGPLEVGYDVPAALGMAEAEIQTPCLVVDLDGFEKNLALMQAEADAMGVALRVHGKMHKSPAVALRQIEAGAVGVCCQKVSEAEAFVRGGVRDVLVSNQVRDPAKLDRLARLPGQGARVAVCVDAAAAVGELAAAAARHGVVLDVLVEIECGAGRCGAGGPEEVVAAARAIAAASSLRFTGVQAYQGALQHRATHAERASAFEEVAGRTRASLAALAAEGLTCAVVTGGGTGSYALEGRSGLFTEIQCGSYAFMDADYGRILDESGRRLDARFRPALFVLTAIMSRAAPGRAVCDAGLKALAVDSGLPVVHGVTPPPGAEGATDVAGLGVRYAAASDEHGVLEDPTDTLRINQRLRLIPGHCDPTCNLHDWLVGVRGGRVESLWPISARGKGF
ncbi:MAG: DSD1 family PLP-dependent enzyme [Pseudomonadota bacterium]